MLLCFIIERAVQLPGALLAGWDYSKCIFNWGIIYSPKWGILGMTLDDDGWFVGFYGISTFVGYLTPNPFLCK